jgi:hypothetical protein
MHSTIIPTLDRTLGALANMLTKAEAHCVAKKIQPEALTSFRMYPDMFPLTKQVQLTCDFAARASARLANEKPQAFADTETNFAELQARIAAARAYIATFPEEKYTDAATRIVTFPAGPVEMKMPGDAYFLGYVLPQFHFHATTVYNILRHNGVEVGKRDYMGVV